MRTESGTKNERRPGKAPWASSSAISAFFIFGVVFSIAAFSCVFYFQKKAMRAVFEDSIEGDIFALEEVLNRNILAVRSMQAFFSASRHVDREEFSLFSKNIISASDSIVALQWAPRVEKADREAFADAARREIPGYEIRELSSDKKSLVKAGDRDFYIPTLYREPLDGNKKLLGFDSMSEEVRREALVKCAKTGQPFASRQAALLEGVKGKQPILGILIAAPAASSSPVKGEKQEGFVLASLQIQRLLNGLSMKSRRASDLMEVEILEVDALGESARIYRHAPSKSASVFFKVLEKIFNFRVEKDIDFGNRTWRVFYSPRGTWIAANRFMDAWIVLFAGLITTVVLTLYMKALVERGEKFEKAVQKRTSEFAAINQRLTESEEKLRGLVSNIPGAVYRYLADENRTTQYLSGFFEKFSGYPATDFINNKVRTFYSVIHPDDRESVVRIVKDALARKSPYVLEYRILHKNGSVRWVYEKGQGVFNSEGTPLCLDGVIFDITEKKILGEQLAQSQKMDAIGKLSGGIAHDFNNQLMVILGYCDFLLQDIPKDDPKYEEVMEIKKASEKSANLTRQLLTFGRRQVQLPRFFDLTELLNNSASMIQAVSGAKITVKNEFDIPEGEKEACFPVKADPAQIEQVLMNLVINSREAMPNGGVLTLGLRRVFYAAGETPQPMMPPGVYVLMSVKDTGVGMSEEVQKHLFEPFFTTKSASKGAGLGLAACYGILKSQGGFIQALSRQGEGSELRVYLPLSDHKPEALESSVNTDGEIPKGTETVLLVEDERGVRDVAAGILRKQGYKVIEAEDAEKAFDIFKQQPHFDILVTDMVLPGMTGKDLVEKIRETGAVIKALFMSGYVQDPNVFKNFSGEIDFLAKPFKAAQLGFKVREILDRKAG